MVGLMVLAAAALGCDEVPTAAAVYETAAAAHVAFSNLDDASFEAAMGGLEAGIGCLREPLSPEQAARVHAARALSAFLEDDTSVTVPTFQAALAVDPALTMAPWLPVGHPIYIELRVAGRVPPSGSARTLKQGEGTVILVDGVARDTVRQEWPMVLQRQQGGVVTDSVLLDIRAELPVWVELESAPLSKAARRHLLLGGGAALTAISSGALLAWSADIRDTYRSSDTTYDQLQALDRRNRAVSVASVGAAAASASLSAALVLTW